MSFECENIIKPLWSTTHLPIHCSIQAYNHQRIYKEPNVGIAWHNS